MEKRKNRRTFLIGIFVVLLVLILLAISSFEDVTGNVIINIEGENYERLPQGCTVSAKCGLNYGDCDSDAECFDGLYCKQLKVSVTNTRGTDFCIARGGAGSASSGATSGGGTGSSGGNGSNYYTKAEIDSIVAELKNLINGPESFIIELTDKKSAENVYVRGVKVPIVLISATNSSATISLPGGNVKKIIENNATFFNVAGGILIEVTNVDETNLALKVSLRISQGTSV